MNIDSIFHGRRMVLAYISVILIFAGLLGCFISYLSWWKKVNAWLQYGDGITKYFYYFPRIGWVSSIIGVIILVFIVITIFLIKPISKNKRISHFIIVLMYLASIVSFAFAITSATMTLTTSGYYFNEEEDFLDDDKPYAFDYKCYYDIVPSLFLSMLDKSIDLNVTEEYYNWSYDFYSKITTKTMVPISYSLYMLFFMNFNDYKKNPEFNFSTMVEFMLGIDVKGNENKPEMVYLIMNIEKPEFNNYLCSSVGLPLLILGIIQFLGDISFIISSCYCNCRKKDENSASEGDKSIDEEI